MSAQAANLMQAYRHLNLAVANSDARDPFGAGCEIFRAQGLVESVLLDQGVSESQLLALRAGQSLATFPSPAVPKRRSGSRSGPRRKT